MASPTILLLSSFATFCAVISFCFDDAAAIVLPVVSSINCAYISVLLLNTLKRGVAPDPLIFLRMRYLIFCLALVLLFIFFYLLSPMLPGINLKIIQFGNL